MNCQLPEHWLNKPALLQAISPNLLRLARLFIQEKPLWDALDRAQQQEIQFKCRRDWATRQQDRAAPGGIAENLSKRN
jgi:hypothetical protein